MSRIHPTFAAIAGARSSVRRLLGGRSKTTLTYAWKALEALRTPQEAVGTMPVTGVTPSPP